MRYVILGNGAAGTEAALAIRGVDGQSPIIIITESHYTSYYRPRLIDFLVSDAKPSALELHDADWYRDRNIWNLLGRKAVRLDKVAQQVEDSFGAVHPYDRLLIATGSRPVVPPIPGIERHGVFTLRSVTDAQKIKAFSKAVRRVAVIGGGLLGLENAFSLAKLDKEVTVIESAPWLLPRQLDEAGGLHLQRLIVARGLRVVCGAKVGAIIGRPGQVAGAEHAEDMVSGVRLMNGEEIEADAVLLSVGIRGDFAFLENSGLTVDRGVVVDDYLKTNVANIWAAGDIIEHRGRTYGLWTTAREQGRIAGLNMAGQNVRYEGSIPSSMLKVNGITVFSMGDPGTDGPGLMAEDEGGYRKLKLKDGHAQSAMVVGDAEAAKLAQDVMKGKTGPDSFAEFLERLRDE